jgi:2-methylaconitate cis-trans-isomerase PrpF
MIEQETLRIYATIMRGGTSKGVFLKEGDLPQDPVLRDRVILAIFGSPDSRQIDGLGGADVLTSKLALIGPPSRPDADVDYTFGQVEVEQAVIHYDGLCGNISAAVAPYAIEEGFVKGVEPITRVRVHSKNTHQIFYSDVPVLDGKPIVSGDYKVDGVPGTGAKIDIDMSATVGSRTGRLLPTGNPVDYIELDGRGEIAVTLLDVVNPCIFVRAEDLGLRGDETPKEWTDLGDALALVEEIRSKCVKLMGLEHWEPRHPIPFVAFVSPARDYVNTLSGEMISGRDVDFLARMILLGEMHKTYAGSVTCVTGAAAAISGSVVSEVAHLGAGQSDIRIGHPGGVVTAKVEIEQKGAEFVAKQISYGRTARRIMDGFVYVPKSRLEA